ncbi:hypothetical protein RHMOL_RhmolUnG0006000 [Rhododendron molle]|nr:hypothetical protein RHMOL_RhmolUnG0006000 [Rhododendron molle]
MGSHQQNRQGELTSTSRLENTKVHRAREPLARQGLSSTAQDSNQPPLVRPPLSTIYGPSTPPNPYPAMAATTRSGHRPATKSSSHGLRPTAAAATGKGGPAATFLDLLRVDLKPLSAIWSGLLLVRPPSTTPSPAAVGPNTNPGRQVGQPRAGRSGSAMGVALVRNLMGRSYGSFCSTKPRRR